MGARGEPAEDGSGGYFRRTFQSLRVRNFRFFVTGNLLSATGTWMQSVAAPFLVLRLTHSGVALGIDTALTFLPILLVGAWGGLIADRFDNRRVQLLTQVLYAASALTLWALVVTGAVHVWMVYAISFFTGCVTAVDMPTRQSFYLEMVGPDDLTNAMSLNTASFNAARILGPTAAAAIIAVAGIAPAFLINAISYIVMIVALLLIRPSELRPRRKVERQPGQIKEGVRYAWRTSSLRLPLLVMGTVFLFAFNYSVLLPLLATRTFHGDSGTYGLMLTLNGIGSLAGALFMASRTRRANVRLLSVLGVAVGALTVAAGVGPWLWIEWAIMPFLGGAFISFAITANSTLQLNANDQMRGRVLALYTVVFLESTPLGGVVAGWVGQHLGSRVGLVGGGLVAVAAGLAGLAALGAVRPRTRRSESPERPIAAPPDVGT